MLNALWATFIDLLKDTLLLRLAVSLCNIGKQSRCRRRSIDTRPPDCISQVMPSNDFSYIYPARLYENRTTPAIDNSSDHRYGSSNIEAVQHSLTYAVPFNGPPLDADDRQSNMDACRPSSMADGGEQMRRQFETGSCTADFGAPFASFTSHHRRREIAGWLRQRLELGRGCD